MVFSCPMGRCVVMFMIPLLFHRPYCSRLNPYLFSTERTRYEQSLKPEMHECLIEGASKS